MSSVGAQVKETQLMGDLRGYDRRELEIEHARLGRLGDLIAKQQGYSGLDGMDAVHRYLIDKYHWQPSQVRGMSDSDLSMLVAGYMEKPSTMWD